MANIWFSSDPHFHHANIIQYANRPFKDVTEMNEFIIEHHNIRVKPEDHWYCLGDVTMERDNQGRGLGTLRRMNGHKRLIMGNHDHYAMRHYLDYFEKVMAMNRLDGMWFTHVPVHPGNLGSCDANIHGHIHDNPGPPPHWNKFHKKAQVYMNVSVEAINYAPVALEELKQMVAKAREGLDEDRVAYLNSREWSDGQGEREVKEAIEWVRSLNPKGS